MIGRVHWKLQQVSYVVSKCYELWSTNGLKLDWNFYPPFVISALLHCQASPTEISKRNSTKRC